MREGRAEDGLEFDAVVGNPPYQERNSDSKTTSIWPLFVKHSIESAKDGGFIALVHPPGWRNAGGGFARVKDELLGLEFLWLSIHGKNDGKMHFNAHTPFDMYIVRNSPGEGELTEIRDMKRESFHADLNGMPFIPNSDFELAKSLLAMEGEDRVDLVFDNVFHTQGKRGTLLSPSRTGRYKHPCVYIVPKKGDPKFFYSNRRLEEKGHFGSSKVIFGGDAFGSVMCDPEGEYGLTNFAVAILDEPENLENLRKALMSDEFQSIMKSVNFGIAQCNKRVIRLFRKDFWKKFV